MVFIFVFLLLLYIVIIRGTIEYVVLYHNVWYSAGKVDFIAELLQVIINITFFLAYPPICYYAFMVILNITKHVKENVSY